MGKINLIYMCDFFELPFPQFNFEKVHLEFKYLGCHQKFSATLTWGIYPWHFLRSRTFTIGYMSKHEIYLKFSDLLLHFQGSLATVGFATKWLFLRPKINCLSLSQFWLLLSSIEIISLVIFQFQCLSLLHSATPQDKNWLFPSSILL